jgi:hypothetical protein
VTGFAFEVPELPRLSRLAEEIAAVHKATDLDEEAAETARSVVGDARRFVAAHLPHAEPRVLLSDDGVLTLQWRKDDRGLIMIFSGDGTATFSIREPGGFYSTNGIEFHLSEGLPVAVTEFTDSLKSA